MQEKEQGNKGQNQAPAEQKNGVTAPAITLPKGGGAIRGIGEKFAANPVTGTGSFTIPIAMSPGRANFGPQLSLAYDSGSGNGPFGFGWSLALPSITRKTDKGLPRYQDAEESDVFMLSGAEDLVPLLVNKHGTLERAPFDSPTSEPGYTVQRYHPRIEGLFARIERWTEKKTGISHWRSISKDNITTLYGKRADARIADPAEPSHIFSWLICESYDDKGNAILYQYKPEDASNVKRSLPEEKHRLISNDFAQRYLKHVKYGNPTPRQAAEDLLARTDWLFEVVFDYGEHDPVIPTTQEKQLWPVRQDPFSSYRAGFEVRTYRLCQRVFMFHHFPDPVPDPDELRSADYLVRSTDFTYTEGPVASFITAATQSGFVRQADGTSLKKSMTKLEFTYTAVRVDETVRSLDTVSGENVPYGLDGTHYQWVDLDSEGLSGVLTEQADAWFYKRNLGNGAFGPVELVASQPSLASLSGGQQQLMDLAGDGPLDLVQFDAPLPGFYERTAEDGWAAFTPFEAVPNVAWKDPNLRFIDLTGDGHADILISEDTVFTWYPSRAEQGFGAAERVAQAWDEEAGPQLVFADATQSVYLADMSGDGLTDLVRIRNGEVCYWPSLGYGRFGAKVTMRNAPLFDYPDLFDQKRIRLADIDGSGTTDILYLGQNDIGLYFNQSGNAWSPPQRLTNFPKIDNLKSVTTVDLLGNGTACLVWSSPLPGDARQPMRYIDLMGGQKPHLLTSMTNNMGAETDVQYAASTKFYLHDRAAGRPWVTRLPFPVHVVERVESRDLVSRTTLVSTYRYQHGYFDGVEREFRGFAYVEQRDAETVSGQFDVPPIVTRTWFHTGAYLEGERLEAYFKDPDHHEYFTGDNQATFLPDTDLPPHLSPEEAREAYRALKGSILRQEIYTEDGTAKAALPYSVSERSYTLRRLQRHGPNLHAVFFSHASETIDYHYERYPADPRISHALTLEVDDYGNVLTSVAIGYQRRTPAFAEQKPTLATLTENHYTDAIIHEDHAYRTPLPAETKTFELTAPSIVGAKPLGLATVRTLVAAATEIAYTTQPTAGQTQKRLIEHVQTLYRKDDLSGLLPLGKLESMALPGESYKLAFTPELLDVFQAKASRADLTALLTGTAGHYRDLDGKGSLWMPSGLIFYRDTPLPELAFAQAHFFLPHRFQDPFENNTFVTYDDHKLLLISTRDAVGNEVHAENDYRVLQPRLVTDPNGNCAEVAFDALGMVVGTSVMGKATGPAEGDPPLTDFRADLTPQEIKDFFDAPNPYSLATTHLGKATTRIIYDLARIPVCAAAMARETHVSALTPGGESKVQLRFVYSDGFGREAQTRIQAEPGPLDLSNPNAPLVNPRWVGTGATVYNNKGKPVRQYEPFFSATPHFGIEQHGVSSTLFYDPVERVVATLHPNHTYEKVVFDPWQQTTYDVNDTVLNPDGTTDPKRDSDVQGFFARLPDADYLPTWYEQRSALVANDPERVAADKAAVHRQTPTMAHLDTLGRTFLTIADNGAAGKYETRLELDIEGNQRAVIDAKHRAVMRYDYDMLSTQIHSASMDAGARWVLNDVVGKPLRAWDSCGHLIETTYDALHRPVNVFVTGIEGHPQRALVEQTVYGEGQGDAKNHRGKVYQHSDGAGIVTNVAYDFKGNVLESSRQLTSEYQRQVDWDAPPTLTETFTTTTTFDALNRPMELLSPHNATTPASTIRPIYNEANLLNEIRIKLRGAQDETVFVSNIDYNAKGQRTRIEYGNGAETRYRYDPDTFRLIQVYTRRGAAFAEDCGVAPPPPRFPAPEEPPQGQPCGLQNLHYTYDPAGNITHIRDDAQQTIYFRNQRVEPSAEYTYDAIYRLIKATGREHLGQVGGAPVPTGPTDAPRVGLDHPNDRLAMGRYEEEYLYDEVGNILSVRHRGTDPNHPGWKRCYQYALDSNRLLSTGGPSDPNNPDSACPVHYAAAPVYGERYAYDAHGNMTSMPHLTLMQWDFKDQLRSITRQAVNDTPPPDKVPETTFYVYDASGQRVHKVTERQNGTRKEERIYLGGFEVYREYDGTGNAVKLERETLHIMDDKQRIALVETKTINKGQSLPTPEVLQRYQFSNHLGSASLELNDHAVVISYEEYYPYGSTSYQAVNKDIKAAAKRYRYTGKERDEESGLYYHGARYYAPWLGKWVSCDPVGMVDGPNLYQYGRSNPIVLADISGTQAAPTVLPTLTEEQLRKSVPSEHLACKVGCTAPFSADVSQSSEQGLSAYTRDALWRSVNPPLSRREICNVGCHPESYPTSGERGFLSRGGGTLISSLAGIVFGLIIIFGSGGLAVPLLLGTLTLSSGVAGTGIGLAQLASSGSRTRQQDAELNRAASAVLGLTSSPSSLAGGTAAAGITGTVEGMERGALIGGGLEAAGSFVYGIGSMAYREYQFTRLKRLADVNSTWRNVRPLIQDVLRLGGKSERSRFNPAFARNTEWLELSHFFAQRDIRGWEWFFNRPWNLKPLWSSAHALVDPKRFHFIKASFKPLYESAQFTGIQRVLRLAPEWMLQAAYGYGQGINIGLRAGFVTTTP